MGEIPITRLVMVAAAVLVALAVWVFLKSGDPDPAHAAKKTRKPQTRYAELVAARREVERRMEDLRLGRSGYRSDVCVIRDETFEQLRAIHAEIEAQLKALKTEG